MEEKLKEMLEHIEENTKFLYPKDVSNETLSQNLVGRGISFMQKPNKQTTVDLCTLALALYLRTKNDQRPINSANSSWFLWLTVMGSK